MTAPNLTAAIELVNATDYGLTSGLHSLNKSELTHWLEHVEAGNLYVNRSITGAIVRRQSFGGWKKSAIGSGTKAGGPNYLYAFGSWSDATVSAETTITNSSARNLLSAAEQADLSPTDLNWLTRAVRSDAASVLTEFGIARDASQLHLERNVLRYLPTAVTIRIVAGTPLRLTLRVLAAALAAGARPRVSIAAQMPTDVHTCLTKTGVTLHPENSSQWQKRVALLCARTGPAASARIRVVSTERSHADITSIFEVTKGKPDIAVYSGEVVSAGRIEMLPFLREQAVSVTAHRFGTPNPHFSAALFANDAEA